MKFINPKYSISDDDNFFSIRKKEYETIIDKITEVIKPIQDLGLTIKELYIKPTRSFANELQPTLKEKLCLKLLTPTNQEIDLSMDIPILIDDNFFMISGKRKIPVFQLFDIPFITRGKNIKIRTNPETITIYKNRKSTVKNPFNIDLLFCKKKVPLVYVLFSLYTKEEINNLVSYEDYDIDDESLYSKLVSDIKNVIATNSDIQKDDFTKRIGLYFSKSNYKSEGDRYLYALDILLKIDIISARYFDKSLIEKIIELIKGKEYDDLDYTNKRIRFLEYVILAPFMKEIFRFCYFYKLNKREKFNINSSAIISACNVSDIIQFDYLINPVTELTLLSRTSLTGPDGFKKGNVPEHLRDVSESMFGRLCTTDTPDRDNCGILQNLCINSKLDSNLNFTEESNDIPISIPISLFPFLEHDDPTRLQMASSQARQSVFLKNFDTPMIKTGCENLYSNYTQFVKSARKNGEVVYLDDKYIIVIYDDTDFDVFNILPRQTSVENVDIFKVYVCQGDKVRKNDILAESGFCKNGEINLGKNLLTAIVPYHGRNYEDAIIVSKKCRDLFTSLHYIDLSFTIPEKSILMSIQKDIYKPLPEINEEIKGEKYKGEKCINNGIYAILKEFPVAGRIDTETIFYDEKILRIQEDVKIYDINIYANNWCDEIPEYNEWVIKKIESQKFKESKFLDIINTHLPKEKAKKFIKENCLTRFQEYGNYKIKGDEIDGIYVEIFGVYENKLNIGDKLANRHGNKGVISIIAEENKLPKLPDGRHVDICINPQSIISRMNIGQVYELHLSMSLYDLKKIMKDKLQNKETDKKLKKYLLDYIKLVDKTKDGWYYNQFKDQIKDLKITEEFINTLTIIQPPFESISVEDIEGILSYTGTKFTYKLFDPSKNIDIQNEIAVGYIYFNKLDHIAKNKINFRSIGSYSKKTMQPLGGRRNTGGQRAGEMEVACIIAHEGVHNLHEFLTLKSDCIEMKNSYIEECYGLKKKGGNKIVDDIPESVRLLKSKLLVLGVEL